jgi:hypothetical protein
MLSSETGSLLSSADQQFQTDALCECDYRLRGANSPSPVPFKKKQSINYAYVQKSAFRRSSRSSGALTLSPALTFIYAVRYMTPWLAFLVGLFRTCDPPPTGGLVGPDLQPIKPPAL